MATFTNFHLSRLTFLLTRRLDRRVLDQTGALNFNTVHRNMGRRLEPRKEPISILVIDPVNEVPTANQEIATERRAADERR